MGGVHVSIFPDEALEHCDMVVIGEGEQAMLDIAMGRINSRIISAAYVKDIDQNPMPARHLMKMDHYLKTKERISGTHLFFVPPMTKVSAMLTSRGCPYKCIFCYNSWRASPLRFHSAKRVIEEIKFLIKTYKVRAIFFFDDDFFFNKKRLKEICQMLKDEKINLIWGCQSRADTVNLEILQMVKAAGCRQVNFGLESGSQKILDILKNDTVSIEINRQAIELCRKVGIISWGTFMIGNPTETLNDIKLTRDFIRKSKLTGAMIHVTTPYPGTKLWDYCVEKKLLPSNMNWSDFTTVKAVIPICESLSNEEINHLRVKILFRDIILTGKFDYLGFLWIALRNPFQQLLRLKRIFEPSAKE